jgi:hypothetical protein
MTGITTEDLVLRLRELLLQEALPLQEAASHPQGETVASGSQSNSDLWQTAAATAVTAVTSVMNGSSHFQTAAARSTPTVAGHHLHHHHHTNGSSSSHNSNSSNSISQAILTVLQGIRPRHQNNSRTSQVYIM